MPKRPRPPRAPSPLVLHATTRALDLEFHARRRVIRQRIAKLKQRRNGEPYVAQLVELEAMYGEIIAVVDSHRVEKAEAT